MLEYQKKKLSEKYSNYILKLEPFLLRMSGYNPQETRLKIDNCLLHCTPSTFSFNKCSLLLFLGNNEVDFFKEQESKLVSLSLAFDSTYFGRPISFFLKGRFEKLSIIKENVYSVDFRLTTISDTYKELFVYLSEMFNIYKKLYITKLTPEQLKGIKKVPLNSIKIINDKQIETIAKLRAISHRHIEFYIYESNMVLELNKTYTYQIIYNNNPITLIGKIVKSDGKSYISSLDFNLEFIHIISKYMNISNTKDLTDSEELEELEEL